MWCGSPLLWRSTKQSMASQSTTEAELQAMASGLQLTMAAREIMDKMFMKPVARILGDSQAAIAVAKNGGVWRSTHYAVKAAALKLASGVAGQRSASLPQNTRSPT